MRKFFWLEKGERGKNEVQEEEEKEEWQRRKRKICPILRWDDEREKQK